MNCCSRCTFKRTFIGVGILWLVSIVLIYTGLDQDRDTDTSTILFAVGVFFFVMGSLGLIMVLIGERCCPNFFAESPSRSVVVDV